MRSLLALLALTGTAWAGELRQPTLELLSGYEDAATPEQLTALGPGVAAELMEIAADGSVARTQRGRAVYALGFFPSEASRAVLVAALDGSDELLARKAAYALGTGWKGAAVPDLERALSKGDVQLRIAAAHALGKVGSDGRAVLKARLQVETDSSVKEAITQAME